MCSDSFFLAAPLASLAARDNLVHSVSLSVFARGRFGYACNALNSPCIGQAPLKPRGRDLSCMGRADLHSQVCQAICHGAHHAC